MRIPIGLELYSVRHAFASDPFGTLKAVAEMGYVGVEFAGPPALSGALLRAMLDELGLVCCGWHTPISMLQGEALPATIALNKAVGNRRVIIPGLPQEMTDSLASWRQSADVLSALADTLAPHDLVTGYHNHTVEFAAVHGETPWDVFFGHADRRVIMQLDTGNAAHGGAASVPILQRYPGRAETVHLKPYTPGEDGFRAPIGEDGLPWPEIFEACETIGGTEWYIVEYESDAYPALEAVARCLQGLKAMGR